MEQSIRENDYVLIVCTPHYKAKSDRRSGGVGFEGDIIQGEVFTQSNHRKFIPLLRTGNWLESAPTALAGKVYIDLRTSENYKENYFRLLRVIHGEPMVPPAIGVKPDFPPLNVSDRVKLEVPSADDSPTRVGSHSGVQPSDGELTSISHTISLVHEPREFVRSVSFSPKGNLIAAAGQVHIALWDPDTHKKIGTLEGRDEYYVNDLAFSPDGDWLTASTVNLKKGDYVIKLWNVLTGREQGSFNAKLPFYLNLDSRTSIDLPIAYSPDGLSLASGSNCNRLILWSMPSGGKLGSWKTKYPATSIVFSPDGKYLASNGHDRGEIRIWDAGLSREVRTLTGGGGYSTAITFSPDGLRLACAEQNYVLICEVHTGRCLRMLKSTDDKDNHVVELAFSPNGRWLAVRPIQGPVAIWDMRKRDESAAAVLEESYSIAFSPDGRWLATGGYTVALKLWNFT